MRAVERAAHRRGLVPRTALGDLLQLDEAQVNKHRLYRALDELLLPKAALEVHLSQRCGDLFSAQNEALLYDVTSTFFEGEAGANPLARRGHSRDHRPDCKQVCIALVVTFDGFPLGYEVFAGNSNDARTLQTTVATMEARHGMLGRVWIADRGMASAESLAWLRQAGRRYIIGAPKSELKRYAVPLAVSGGWRSIRSLRQCDRAELSLVKTTTQNAQEWRAALAPDRALRVAPVS
ncbi:MAG: IS1634 family transposase [Alphaproteobacteria bacterium]|nr:IS1634 family transposase [Alphaproteobacteria bacterium]